MEWYWAMIIGFVVGVVVGGLGVIALPYLRDGGR